MGHLKKGDGLWRSGAPGTGPNIKRDETKEIYCNQRKENKI